MFMKIQYGRTVFKLGLTTCIYALFLSILGSCSTSLNTSIFSKKVVGLPQQFLKPDKNLRNHFSSKKGDIPWIVYSDRVDNYTTTSPGGSLLVEKLDFMEPFYVAEDNGSYLKLVRFKASMINGLKFKDKKSAESIGWISKEKLLLWNKSYVSKNMGYADKSVAMINGVDPLLFPNQFFDKKDSLLVFDSPELKNIIGKVALHEYVYVYKQSSNRKQYLIGLNDQFVLTERNKSVKGWVSSDVVSPWGNRLYLFPNTTINDSISVLDSLNNKLGLFPYNFVLDPLVDTSKMILSTVSLGEDGRAYYSLPLYHKTNNYINAINGSQLYYHNYVDLKQNRPRLNIVFVVDGGKAMKDRFPGLVNTIQSFEKNVYEFFNPHDVKFGSVVYRSKNHCGIGNSSLSLGDDYRELVSFLKAHSSVTANCMSNTDGQSVFEGLEDAVKLLNNVPNQTNLVVVLGSIGDSAGLNDHKIYSLGRQLATVDARMLFMQVFNDANSQFDSFIIQSRKLLSEEAHYAAENRKSKSIEGDAFSSQNYLFNLTDSNSYYLDFPKNSLVQGAVVFPNRYKSLSPSQYNIAFNRILNETKYDINMHLNSLDSSFKLIGVSNRNITSQVVGFLDEKFSTQVGDHMPHNEFAFAYSTPFYVDSLVNLKGSGLELNLLLNAREYKVFLETLALLTGENLNEEDANFRANLVQNYISYAKLLDKERGGNLSLSKWDLNEYFEYVLGIPFGSSEYSSLTLSALSKEKEFSKEKFEKYITYLRNISRRIRDYSAESGKYYSNGELYYRIRGSFFN